MDGLGEWEINDHIEPGLLWYLFRKL